MILQKKKKNPQFVKLKTELYLERFRLSKLVMAPLRFICLSLTSTDYSDFPSLYRPLSFSISLFQTVIKRIFKWCNDRSLGTLNWLGGRNLSGQVCTLLQRRSRTECKADWQGRVFLWLFLFNEWKQWMLVFLDSWNEKVMFGFEFFVQYNFSVYCSVSFSVSFSVSQALSPLSISISMYVVF